MVLLRLRLRARAGAGVDTLRMTWSLDFQSASRHGPILHWKGWVDALDGWMTT